MSTGRKKVIFILSQIDRIGELAGELFYLRNLYPETEHDITVVTYPPEYAPRTNRATFYISTRGVNVLHSIDDRLIWYPHHDRYREKVFQLIDSEFIFFLYHPEYLAPAFMRERRGQPVIHPFNLSENEMERGKVLRAKFCIPQSAPIITIHVREGGYLPTMAYHSYRDSDIANYLPALDYLINKGFYIVRLGDNSMKRLEKSHEQLIDAPFHPAYTDLVEPYFISQSKFYISTGSGPHSIARGFGIPALQTNLPILVDAWGEPDDLLIHKKYYSQKLQRHLSYEEVLTSPAIEYFKAEQYLEAGLEVIENSPDEILLAVEEMNNRLDGKYSAKEEIVTLNNQIRTIRQGVHEKRQLESSDTALPFLPAFWWELQLSNEFVKASENFFV